MIFFTPEYGFTWLETLIGVKGIDEVHKAHGDVGVYYVLAFGHAASYLKNEPDYLQRDQKVLDEIKLRKLGTGRTKSKFVDRYFETDECKTAIIAANNTISFPEVRRLDSNRELESYYLSQLTKKAWIEDPEKRAKELAADKIIFELLTKVRAEIRKEEEFVLKMVSRTGMISLDEFLYQ